VFQWGASQCSGFLILNVPMIDHLWHLASKLDLYNIADELHVPKNDQLIFKALNRSHPEIVSMLPKEWDVPLTEGLWKGVLKDHRPDGVGHIHLNGGGSDNKNAFLTSVFVTDKKHKSGWGLANYYIHMPWPYAKFIVESSKGDSVGHQLVIRNIRGASSDLNKVNSSTTSLP
jgi:hypothetical protein